MSECKVRRTEVSPFRVSVTLVKDAPVCTDNQLQTKEEVLDFFRSLIAMLGRQSPFFLAEMARIAGPQFWLLCCYASVEFVRLFHLGRYENMAKDSMKQQLAKGQNLRAIYTNFRRYWAYRDFTSPVTKSGIWIGADGRLFSPTPDEPAFTSHCVENPNEFVLEWYNRGRVSRRVLDSRGATVNPRIGWPCSVTSRDHVVDQHLELPEEGPLAYDNVLHFDDLENLVAVYTHATWLQLKYERHDPNMPDRLDCGYVTVELYPDSDVELANLKASGYHANHPAVRRNYPHLWHDIQTPLEGEDTYFYPALEELTEVEGE